VQSRSHFRRYSEESGGAEKEAIMWKDDPVEGKEKESGYVTAPLLDVSEAAKYLGVGRKVLYQLIERGEITVVKSGKTTLVEKKSLDDFRRRGTLT
jgi:excisionase family DNA binding protein